jgi:hypothetical protein
MAIIPSAKSAGCETIRKFIRRPGWIGPGLAGDPNGFDHPQIAMMGFKETMKS